MIKITGAYRPEPNILPAMASHFWHAACLPNASAQTVQAKKIMNGVVKA